MKISKKILSCFLMVLFLVGQIHANSVKKILNVAVVFRFDDKYNATPKEMLDGINIAKTLYEKEYPNTTIKLHLYSHNEDLESVLSAANQIIRDKIPAVIGGELSNESFVLSEKLGEHKIIFITPTSSNPLVTHNKPYSFQGCFSDDEVANRLAVFITKYLKPSALGVIHDVSSPYPDYLTKKFIEAFNQDTNNTVLADEEKIMFHVSNYEPQIKSFIKNKVTHVVFLDYQGDLLTFVTQARKLHFFPIYIGSDGWGSNEAIFKNLILEDPGDKKFVGYRNLYWKQGVTNQMTKKFQALFSKRHNYQAKPNAWDMIAFDTAWVLFSAMAQSTSPTDADEVKNHLEKIKNLQLITTNNFSFAPNHSPIKDLYIYRIDHSGIHYQATLK